MLARDDYLNMAFFRSQGMMGGPFVQLEMPLDPRRVGAEDQCSDSHTSYQMGGKRESPQRHERTNARSLWATINAPWYHGSPSQLWPWLWLRPDLDIGVAHALRHRAEVAVVLFDQPG